MTDYLLFLLYGPLASWGEIAVGEARHSAVHPSKSALLGLLGAALGIRRDDEAVQQALAQGYRFGFKLLCEGAPLRDYHTVQAPAQQRNRRHRTRRQELADKDRLGTLLSTREYRCDSVVCVAVEALPAAPYSLPALAEALRRPRLPLYLGRKSCPPALPLRPQCLRAEDVLVALDGVSPLSLLALLEREPQQPWPSAADRRVFKPARPRYYWEEGMAPAHATSLVTTRHDQPLSRSRWQFAPRREVVWLGEEQA